MVRFLFNFLNRKRQNRSKAKEKWDDTIPIWVHKVERSMTIAKYFIFIVIFAIFFLILNVKSFKSLSFPRHGNEYSNNLKSEATNSSITSLPKYLPKRPSVDLKTTPLEYWSAPPSTFQRYIKWHKVMRACLARPTCEHSPKVLLWRCKGGVASHCWGIGDRFRGICSSLVLAMMTDRLFLLDWPNQPFPIIDAVIPSKIDWTLPKGLDYSSWPTANDEHWPFFQWERCPIGYICIGNGKGDGSLKTGSKLVMNTNLNLSHSETYELLKNLPNFVIHSRSLNSFRNRLIARPEWKKSFHDFSMPQMSQFNVNRFLLKSLFQPSPMVASLLDNLIPDKLHTHGYISIHARTGEDVGEQALHRFFGLQMNRSVLGERFLNCAFTNGLKNGGHIFIASDSWKLKSSIVLQAIQKNISVYYTKQAAKHIASFNVENASLAAKLAFEGYNDLALRNEFFNIFVEFFGLARGKMMIGNRSEFSRLAFLIGDGKKRRIVNATCGVCKCA